jgi:anaerobic ribonucleoside-triphosphate reductase
MAMMTLERLHDLLDENQGKDALAWQGVCHDCQCEIRVTAIPKADGIHIKGGGVYEPEADKFIMKCNDCFVSDPVLRNYQDCEVYSRVVGYLRPVNQWNDAKFAEFHDRKLFDASIR